MDKPEKFLGGKLSSYMSIILSYILISLVYLGLCLVINKVIRDGIYSINPIYFGFLLSTMGFLFFAGISFIVGGHDIPSIPGLVIGILIFCTALWVFESVLGNVIMILVLSTVIVAVALVSGLGARHIISRLSFNGLLLWVFISVVLSFFIQQLRSRANNE